MNMLCKQYSSLYYSSSPSASCDHSTSGRELGRLRSVIELDSPSVTAEQVAAIEQSVNEKIRDRLPVNVRELSLDDPEVEQVRGEPGGVFCRVPTRGLLIKIQTALLLSSCPR